MPTNTYIIGNPLIIGDSGNGSSGIDVEDVNNSTGVTYSITSGTVAPLSISANGTYSPSASGQIGFNRVTVDVSGGSGGSSAVPTMIISASSFPTPDQCFFHSFLNIDTPANYFATALAGNTVRAILQSDEYLRQFDATQISVDTTSESIICFFVVPNDGISFTDDAYPPGVLALCYIELYESNFLAPSEELEIIYQQYAQM